MPDYVKGNYSLPRKKRKSGVQKPSKKAAPTPQEEFEARALTRLGGSIAFVIKPTLVWDGDDDEQSG